jgi:hypothetical protein
MAKVFAQPYVQRVEYLGTGSTKVFLTFVDNVDGVTLLTGVAPARVTAQLSKAGAAWASLGAGTVTSLGNGVYTITMSPTDKNAYGPALIRAVASTPTSYETHAMVWVGVNNEDEGGNVTRIRRLHAGGL